MDFAEYNEHTEELVRFLIERLTEDEILAGAMRHPRVLRAVLAVGPIRENINDYRRAAHKVFASGGGSRWWWLLVARYHAFCLRVAARQYTTRGGFDQAWLRAPQWR